MPQIRFFSGLLTRVSPDSGIPLTSFRLLIADRSRRCASPLTESAQVSYLMRVTEKDTLQVEEFCACMKSVETLAWARPMIYSASRRKHGQTRLFTATGPPELRPPETDRFWIDF